MKHPDELKKIFLFRELPDRELGKLGAIAHEHTLSPGVELFREGQEITDFFVIVIGTVKVLKKAKTGGNEEIATLGTGSYFGEVELVRPDRHAAATIETTEPTTVLALPYADLEKLCDEDRELAVQLYRAIAKGLARRLAQTDETAANYRMMAVKKRN